MTLALSKGQTYPAHNILSNSNTQNQHLNIILLYTFDKFSVKPATVSVAGNFPLNSLLNENGLALEEVEKCLADVCEGAADIRYFQPSCFGGKWCQILTLEEALITATSPCCCTSHHSSSVSNKIKPGVTSRPWFFPFPVLLQHLPSTHSELHGLKSVKSSVDFLTSQCVCVHSNERS